MKARGLFAILPAAGTGERLGANRPKAFVMLSKKPLLWWAFHSLKRNLPFKKFIVPIHPDWVQRGKKLCKKYKIPVEVIPGGRTRGESVFLALARITEENGTVFVHDAARPFVGERELKQLYAAVLKDNCAILAIQATSTVKEVHPNSMKITRTLERSKIYLAQTPQASEIGRLKRAYKLLGKKAFSYTDEASLLEAVNLPVTVVPGSVYNIKITHPEDLKVAQVWAKGNIR